jgi:predicted metal-dependent HD superfamily phosphohydrolase
MEANEVMDMQERWHSLARDMGVDDTAAQTVFAELVALYEADGRAYHNLTHIQQMLIWATAVREQAVEWTAVRWAIWFHDAVYVPGAADNEAQSAQFARRVLQKWPAEEVFIAAVEQLILATVFNGRVCPHPDAPLIQDADIAILGQPPAVYRQYAQAIRQEYAHVPDDAYRHGRGQVLTYFLAQKRLYQTAYFFTHLEEQARHNLRQELAALKSA